MKKLIFLIATLALMAIALPSCAATGVSQVAYDELKNQLDAIEAKIDTVEAGLSEIQDELEATPTQEPITRQKLVGMGPIGYDDPGYDGTHISANAIFIFTNPDSVSEITIDRISIIRGDGAIVYEGPLLLRQIDGQEVNWIEWMEPMKPHEIRAVILDWYLCDRENYRESIKEVRLQHLMFYTVEIFWTGSDGGLPLMGWSFQDMQKIDEKGNLIFGDDGLPEVMPTWSFSSGTPMVNVEQQVEPKD